ncbi:2-succinyl-6-hydroxy-2,4-cyclohexadiene-1-carboxylate synthase [Photobacterium sagamiensis]|uniref:2-succinyl-6-hydroxy-2, 4-cyclohexadiene-1-carboxylate synthase n=1 Tax=Photobacterium sagamiensis TaxID=2910241 RepID=UPI003D0E1D66
MPLYSESYGVRHDLSQQQPTLVFLHGLLGSGRDWRHVVNVLSQHYFCLTIDLPGHGNSQMLSAADFVQVNQLIHQTLAHRHITSYVLIGYSMGARLAMYHATHPYPESPARLAGMILEGGHFGLPQIECAGRFSNDEKWAHRFACESLGKVLPDWYQQPVFSSLNHDQRQSLVLKRSDNLGPGVARMLLATSLAMQPPMQEKVEALSLPVLYVCGEQDGKFRRLVEGTTLDYLVIPSAGHNVHVERPHEFSMAINNFVKQIGIKHG